MNDGCIFCNVSPDVLVYSGADGIVLLDGPARPGHVLVGIKNHHPDLHDVPPEEAAAMMRLAVRTSKAIVQLTGAAKTYVVAVGDKDRHFHVHLLPKMDGDPSLGPHVFSGTGWASFLPPEPNASEVQKIQNSLAAALRDR